MQKGKTYRRISNALKRLFTPTAASLSKVTYWFVCSGKMSALNEVNKVIHGVHYTPGTRYVHNSEHEVGDCQGWQENTNPKKTHRNMFFHPFWLI